jgi:hypothetical protein
MAKSLVDDELWELIQPLLPRPKPRRWRYPGRKPVSDRQALTGILVCPEEWHPLGDAAPGNGLWLGHDLLVPSARLAGSWGLAEAP